VINSKLIHKKLQQCLTDPHVTWHVMSAMVMTSSRPHVRM